ncbi:hypothetical protein AK812_SmicGene4650 [Symbiodinium microadriaticum]|uniref:Uncharacterized protein n=1 Tax=Symbiodinium microadriaticum TaxID=2951 RepID=A0A1Q9EVM5_SYMMI|nr:hypothetical protein AK812_SmicGene4650 [Symbiodinium microadriaticum]
MAARKEDQMREQNLELLSRRDEEYQAKVALEKQREKERSIALLKKKEQEVHIKDQQLRAAKQRIQDLESELRSTATSAGSEKQRPTCNRQRRGLSGREELRQSSRIYLLFRDYAGWGRLASWPVSKMPETDEEEEACLATQREQVVEDVQVKVWVGYLSGALESTVEFPEGDQGPEVECAFVSEDDSTAYLPAAAALIAVADEKFAFASAVSQESQNEARLNKLEAGLLGLQTTLQDFIVAQQASRPKPAKSSEGAQRLTHSQAARQDAYGGLDPTVVQSARTAGIPEAHLAEMARLTQTRSVTLGDLPRRGRQLDPLGEDLSEEEGEPKPHGSQRSEPTDTVAEALVKLTSIVDQLSGKKKRNSLEEILDEAPGPGAAESSSISSGSRRQAAVLKALRRALVESPAQIFGAIDKAMREDFGSRVGAPGEASHIHATYRGWVEHRSRIPNIQSSARVSWSAAGALDSLVEGKVDEAKARLGLLIAQLDQVAYDRGQWLIASEAALEPPFSSFARHVLPDANEAQFSKLLDPRWIEAFVSKVKEMEDYVDRRDRLTRRGSLFLQIRQPPNQIPQGRDPPRKARAKARERAWAKIRRANSKSELWRRKLPSTYEQEWRPNLWSYSDALWSNSSYACPRMVFKSNGTFASFCKSLFRTASPPLEGATAQLWPMPVPYPQVLRREAGPKEGDFSFKRAICIEVLALNWLYLRRAPSAPSSIALGRPLTRSQWRLVRELEHQSRAWIGKTVSASEMGRSASKIESIEAALAYLGRLDRVEESGSQPGFEPSPYLDELSRKIFERSPSMTGIIIDDLICLEVLASRALREGQEGVSSQQVRGMLPRYISSGLVPHEKKTFYQKVQADFWGASLDGEVGQVRASLSRVLPVSLVTSMIVRIGLVSVALLEIVVGSWTSTFLFRRRLLSLLSVVYEPLQRGLPRSTVIRLSPELAEELLLVLSLAPLAVSDLRATNSQHVYCSDASDWGIGVTRARLPEGLEAEVHRHKLRRPTWVKLLSPLRKLQRIRGQLPLDEELPGEQQLPSHPLWLALGGALQYKEILRKKVSRPTHINILELRGMAKAEEIASQEGMRRRVFQLADSQVSLGAWTKGRAASRALNQELQQSLPIHLGCNMQSSAGFLPTEYNSADGPSRNTRPQEPIISIPECFYHLPDLGPFDRWLESHGADPYTISGLPPLEELGAEIQVQVRSSGRSRAGGRAFRQPNCPLSREKGQFIRTSCDVLSPGRAQADKLEAGAIAILQHYSVEQFVLPRAWLQGEDWRPTGPGFLELSSAQKGLAAALAEYSQTWVLVLEFTEDTFQAADSRQGHEDVFQLIERGAVLGVGCSMLGSSFSRAIRPAWRSSVYPGGLESLEGRAECRVAKGNALAAFIAKVISACLSAELLYWVENPSDSFLWRLPSFITLGSREAENLFRFDQCRFLAPWRKRTTILTNSHLRGFSMFCNGGHRHRRLSGYSKEFHCCWTRASQIYPRRLRQLLGYAIAFDAGLLPGRRPITAATLAKQSHGRIGEAQNPGPRLPRDLRHRDDIDLSSIELVTANTSKLGQRVHSLFQDWCQESVGEEAARNLLSCANTAGELAKEFGYFLFSAKHPLYMYRQLLAYLQRERPMLRGHLAGAWQVVSKWERVEPIEHRSPVPHVLLRALVSLAVAWRWQRVAAVILIMFFGVARPGEVLQAARRDLLLPRDLETESATAFYLKVVAPKTRHRGLGKIQHTKVDDAHVTAFCEGVFGGLPWHERLYPGSPASFRRRWDTLLAALQVPKKLRLTPAGLRAGGAVFAYRQDIELQKLLWRMRLSNLQTLQHYVQEVGAESVVVQLPPRARELVSTSSSFFEFFLATFNP